MADIRDGQPPRLSPEGIAGLVYQLLQLADSILRIFGRRRSDRPDRERASAEPEGPASTSR